MHIQQETICALATATGGALAIIRVSGTNALDIVQEICTCDFRSAKANTVHHCHILDHKEVIDDVLVNIYHAPHSYTGEDSVEIMCHGSAYIARKILQLLVDKGCRMAQPGEYTQRAFLNGKLDLAQAEAVADLIASTNKATHRMAIAQLRGSISNKLVELRSQLLQLTSMLELELDFSDHEELEFADRSELLSLAQSIEQHISQLTHSFEQGQALKNGIPVAIVGKTNVGKSTLLNALLKDNRAIVSDIHGTTRDTIEDTIDLQGATFRFIDTAGIRQTADQIEQIGIERTYQAIEKARIVIWMIDEVPDNEEQQAIAHRCKGKSLIVLSNKIDKGIAVPAASITIPYASFHQISAKQNVHIEQLEQAIYEAALLPDFSENEVIISNARHYDTLCRAHESISRVLQGMNEHLSGDLLSEDLRQVLAILAEITGGQITTDEVLSNIFSHFCVGK